MDESIRRVEFGKNVTSHEKIISLLVPLQYIPETIVSMNNIILQNQDSSILRITNKCGNDNAMFGIFCKGESTVNEDGQAFDHQPRGSFGFPS